MAKNCYVFSSRKARSVPGLLSLSLAAFLVLAPVSGLAQSSRDMANRLDRMENEIQTLSRAVYKGEKPPAGAYSGGSTTAADVELRLQRMEADLRELRGRIEEQSHETRQLKESLERLSGDLELRLGELEGAGPAQRVRGDRGDSEAAGSPGSGRAAGEPSFGDDGYRWGTDRNSPGEQSAYSTESGEALASPSSDKAASSYENAFALIKAGNYEAARSAFQEFLDRYPDHVLAGNAKYWLGEAYYAKGKYEDAARIFAEGYKQYPKGSKAADNLLKLGLSLEALGKKDDACVALRQLQKENMAGAAPVIRRAEQEIARIGC